MKKLKKDMYDTLSIGMMSAYGSNILSEAGNPKGAAAMGKFSSKLPLMANISTSTYSLKMINKLNSKNKIRRKKK